LEHINFPKDKKVYIVGEVGIEEELALKGINYCGGPADANQKIELKAGYALPHDEDVSCNPLISGTFAFFHCSF
jgi:phosphoglycolate phosphatase